MEQNLLSWSTFAGLEIKNKSRKKNDAFFIFVQECINETN